MCMLAVVGLCLCCLYSHLMIFDFPFQHLSSVDADYDNGLITVRWMATILFLGIWVFVANIKFICHAIEELNRISRKNSSENYEFSFGFLWIFHDQIVASYWVQNSNKPKKRHLRRNLTASKTNQQTTDQMKFWIFFKLSSYQFISDLP